MIEIDSFEDIVILEEGSGPSLFPSSCGRSHEARNPFRPREDKLSKGNATPKYLPVPCKPSKPDYLESSARAEIKQRPKSVGDCGLVEPEEVEEVEKRGTWEIKPYQTKLNEELEEYFKKLLHFKGIDEDWVRSHKVNLQSLKAPKKTLILDLDGTLIYNVSKTNDSIPDYPKPEVVAIHQVQRGEKSLLLSYYVRPHVQKLLDSLSRFYEIIVFTAGKELYAKTIVENLDPTGNRISYYLHRSHCAVTRNWVVKDLRIIGRRELKDMVILDNSVVSFAGNLDNGIYIPSFKGDPKDNALQPIIEFLEQIANVEDVRPYVRRFSGIRKLLAKYKATV